MTVEHIDSVFLSVDFGDFGGRLEWLTFTDFQKWCSELKNSWSWLEQLNQQAAWSTLVHGLSSPLNQLQQAETYRVQDQESNFVALRDDGKIILERFVNAHFWILPNSTQYQFVFEIKDSGKLTEAGVLVTNWFGLDLNVFPIRSVVWALIQNELFERGIKDRLRLESAALKRLVGGMQTKLTEVGEKEKDQVNRFTQTHSDLLAQVIEQKNAFLDAQTDRTNKWDKKLNQATDELDRLKDTYDKFMSLAAPVKYWESKQKRHSNWMKWTGGLLVVCMFLAGCFLNSEIESIGKAAALRQAETKRQAEIKNSNVLKDISVAASSANSPYAGSSSNPIVEAVEIAASWRLGSFILLATLCFWMLRLLVRIFLSNMHLENDASERVTMAKTYLALLRKGRLPEKEDISMVLAALFRPSGDGIVQDEGVPPSTLEWFTKLGK